MTTFGRKVQQSLNDKNMNQKDFAKQMGITTRAVDNYMTRILSKLAVSSKKELIYKFGDL